LKIRPSIGTDGFYVDDVIEALSGEEMMWNRNFRRRGFQAPDQADQPAKWQDSSGRITNLHADDIQMPDTSDSAKAGQHTWNGNLRIVASSIAKDSGT
jgi:hypothetical protein